MGNMTMLLQETIQGNRVVKAFGMEDYEKQRFGEENERLFRLYMKGTRIRAFTKPMMEMLAAFGIAGVVWYGGYSVINGGRTQGEFLAFLTALFLLYDPFKGLAKTNTIVQQAHGCGRAGLRAARHASRMSSIGPARARSTRYPRGHPLRGRELSLRPRAGAARHRSATSTAARSSRWSA